MSLRRAVARVPDHLQLALAAVVVAQHAGGIVLGDVDLAVGALGRRHHVALGGHPADLLDLRAEEGLLAQHHLEAVVVRRVVAAGDHDGAVGSGVVAAKYSIGVATAADAERLHAAGAQPGDQLRLQVRGGQPAVIADRNLGPAAARATMEPKQRPMAKASSGWRVFPTIPRMSYSRSGVGRNWCGTVIFRRVSAACGNRGQPRWTVGRFALVA